jgi:hypothetical protein
VGARLSDTCASPDRSRASSCNNSSSRTSDHVHVSSLTECCLLLLPVLRKVERCAAGAYSASRRSHDTHSHSLVAVPVALAVVPQAQRCCSRAGPGRSSCAVQ